ncbi:hypothetical protein TcCL_Unassigned03803 [Trypanosoma cruzi]|nr:hypothetical protein TcCL_Unassigned03803 [Trypanosoma cruzi]
MLKVWLREPHQSDDEAIKLMVDEEADVSDVLLKAPELLRVQQLKPSEIRAEFEDTVLSNRLLVSSVFEGKKRGYICYPTKTRCSCSSEWRAEGFLCSSRTWR